MKAAQDRKGSAGGFKRGTTDSGSKFRRPPEAPVEGDAAKK